MSDLIPPLILSTSGVAVAAAAFINRDREDWRRATPLLLAIAVGQVVLGAAAWLTFGT